MSAMLVAALMAALALSTGSSQAQTRPVSQCWAGYSYVGATSPVAGFGVSATIGLAGSSSVADGHVAAWVGFGGVGMGPGGSDEWIQAGIARDAGTPLDVLYYEYKRPGDDRATYVPLGATVPGMSHTFVVYERAAQRDAWRVMIDGVKVSDPIVLPGSHGAFQPVATAENWDGGVAGTCNGYAYDFKGLAVRTQWGGRWQPFDLSRMLHDPAYQLAVRRTGFFASSR